MGKSLGKILLFAVFLFLAGFSLAIASGLGHVSDTISNSGPSASSSHEIKFVTAVSIPPAGRIVIIPEGGNFFIPPYFSFADIDIATASALSGSYNERGIGPAATAEVDGVSIASGLDGSISIILNSSYGIPAGDAVRIILGGRAQHGATGSVDIVNPATTGSYRLGINIFDNSDRLQAAANYQLVAIVEPVAMTAEQTKIRSNGSPYGFLEYGTTQTYMSLNTNYPADCRYSVTPNTNYNSMTNNFIYTGEYFHSILLTALAPGEYNFYIRCFDLNLLEPDIDDYLINFTIKAQGDTEGEGEGDEGGDETGGSGGAGAGGGSGGGYGQTPGPGTGELLPYPPLPDKPSVSFLGWAYPASPIYILKDGVEEKKSTADSGAVFNILVEELNEGVYTFGLWAQDSEGRKSTTYSTTFWVKEGTKSVVSDIILPPTVELKETVVQPGELIQLQGQTVPASAVDVWLYPDKSGLTAAEIIKQTIFSGENGRWEAAFPTSGLANGVYVVKARSEINGVGWSEFGQILKCGLGADLPAEICAGADLNGDGRVNITDFSILLYWWGSDDACADQNKDGTVDLIDFSIMMYYWTG